MKRFFEGLALRIKKGESGLSGNEITFETEGCARDLEAYRQRTGITWKEVAARCGLTAPLFSGWHAGKRVPSDYTLNAVERFLSGRSG